ncbi:hypothetical protein EJB05_19793, partial [Eragrostis curvula]
KITINKQKKPAHPFLRCLPPLLVATTSPLWPPAPTKSGDLDAIACLFRRAQGKRAEPEEGLPRGDPSDLDSSYSRCGRG